MRNKDWRLSQILKQLDATLASNGDQWQLVSFPDNKLIASTNGQANTLEMLILIGEEIVTKKNAGTLHVR